MATSTVNSLLRSVLTCPLFRGLALTACVLLPVTCTSANPAAERDVLRVDVPLERSSFKNGELKISSLIADNTYIDVEDFNLRAIELEASSTRDGEVRLKVGRYVTPPVPLPGPNNEGLLRIEAPHKSNKSWRLLIEDRINITSLTAVLEPREDEVSYYESRYKTRGYTLGRDDNYRSYSRHDSWPYSWLGNNYDYNRRSAHWFWLNDTRSRFHYNPGYGHSHRHTRRCYDRYGRHMRFNTNLRSQHFRGFNRYRGSSAAQRREHRSDDRDNRRKRRAERHTGDREVVVGPQKPPRRQNPIPNTNRERMRRSTAPPPNSNAQRHRAAQAQLQQRMQQNRRLPQPEHRQQRDRSQERSSRSLGNRYNRGKILRGDNAQHQEP